jgi:hypothetical protein
MPGLPIRSRSTPITIVLRDIRPAGTTTGVPFGSRRRTACLGSLVEKLSTYRRVVCPLADIATATVSVNVALCASGDASANVTSKPM